MTEQPNKNTNTKYILAISAASVFILAVIFIFIKTQRINLPAGPSGSGNAKTSREKLTEIKKFASEQEFKDYLEKSENTSGFIGGRGGGEMGGPTLEAKSADGIGGAVPTRVSETNVQVAGIDEPDALKSDGKEIYFSVSRPEIMPLDDTAGRSDESAEISSLSTTGGTKAIKAFPVEDLGVDGKIHESGDLLLVNKTLIIIPSQRYYWNEKTNRIFGYDISDPKNPKEIWHIDINSSASIAGARLFNNKIYLALKTDFSDDHSCILKPLVVGGADFSIRCTEIYHPTAVVPAEATYTAVIINPKSGEVEKDISFVGSSDYTSSVVYMSESALYLTYYYPGDFVKILNAFFEENKDLVPSWLIEKMKNLESYDISSSAKITEIWQLIGKYQNSLSDNDRMKMENEIQNRISGYLTKHRRELDATGVVKIDAQGLDIDSVGNIPGKLLNQFSIDEYKGELRLATTVGESFLGWGFRGISTANDTANDVYILSDSLKTEGSVIDLGQGERIYAVRFIGDKGYVVTFRQIDPFYVLDLTDPVNPAKAGELKIPGYSSYLHPISENKILGIGEENNKVKISLFDVSSPANPSEVSKYSLEEYWSEAANNHHAFLLDPKHQIFFLPGSKGGYIFSYEGDNLELVKTISDARVKRAVYVDDYLYVVGENSLTVLDERNWEEVRELEL